MDVRRHDHISHIRSADIALPMVMESVTRRRVIEWGN